MGKRLAALHGRSAAGFRGARMFALLFAALLWGGPSAAATSEESASAIAALNAGTAAIQSGRALEAIDYFNSAIESGALSAEGTALAYHHRGIAHQKLGLAGHAVADYTSAIWQGGLPDIVLPRSYYNRAVAYAQMGQQDRAEKDYDKAIELAPDYAAAYHNRGNLRRHLGRHEAAVADYQRALELGMKEAGHLTYFARALSYNALGNRAAALDDTAQALELRPDFAPARNAMAEWGDARIANMAAAKPVESAPAAAADPIVTASLPDPAPAAEPVKAAPEIARSPIPPAVVPPATAPVASVPAKPVPATPELEAGRPPAKAAEERGPVRLTPPNVAAIEPQTGNVTVTPLAQALPPAREDEGWTATVTRFARPPAAASTTTGRTAAVPSDRDLATASIDTDAGRPSTTSSDVFQPRALRNNSVSPIVVAQSAANSATDAGSGQTARSLRVQVGSFRSASDATSAWDKISKAHGELVGRRQPYIVEADLGARGIYYRLQMGPFSSNNEAQTFCRAMKARGQDCIVAPR